MERMAKSKNFVPGHRSIPRLLLSNNPSALTQTNRIVRTTKRGNPPGPILLGLVFIHKTRTGPPYTINILRTHNASKTQSKIIFIFHRD